MQVELPDGAEDGDVIAKQGNKEVALTRDEEGQLGFLPVPGKVRGSFGHYSTHYETVTLGFKRAPWTGKK